MSDKGKYLRADQVGYMVGRYICRAGIDRLGACHLFRHVVATAILDVWVYIRRVQKNVGHVSITTTQIYLFFAIKRLKKSNNKTHPACR